MTDSAVQERPPRRLGSYKRYWAWWLGASFLGLVGTLVNPHPIYERSPWLLVPATAAIVTIAVLLGRSKVRPWTWL